MVSERQKGVGYYSGIGQSRTCPLVDNLIHVIPASSADIINMRFNYGALFSSQKV